MSQSATLLVTGASGQLGRRVIAHLLDTYGVPASAIIATTRKPETLAELAERGVTVRAADFDDSASLPQAFAGADRMLLVSTDAIEVAGARQRQHLAALEAAVKAGVGHVVYTSMPRPEPGSPIAFAPDHYATEQALEHSPLSWTILRNYWYTDLLMMSLPSALESGQLFSAAGDLGVAYVSREDCARTAAAALAADSTERRRFDVTGPQAISHPALAAIVSDITGTAIEVVPVTPAQLGEGMKAHGVPPFLADLLVSFDINTKAGNVASTSDTVETLTGRPPQTVREFLIANLV